MYSTTHSKRADGQCEYYCSAGPYQRAAENLIFETNNVLLRGAMFEPFESFEPFNLSAHVILQTAQDWSMFAQYDSVRPHSPQY